jgi:uncharacterized protein (DUF2236 family)
MTAVQTADSEPTAITHLGPGQKPPKELRDALAGTGGGAVAGANIVMQLAMLGVGHGVAESRVKSGALYERPIKRARTTFGYVGIALYGIDEERAALERVVTDVHRQVKNLPGEAVRYTALDPKLQLWVAACIYKGLEDAYELIHGKEGLDDFVATVYPHAARLGTTLQVPADLWPADRAAFEDYWQDQLQKISMDDVTRTYLSDFTRLGFLPFPVPQLFGRFHQIVCAGSLSEEFRRELGLPWGRREQQVYEANAKVLRFVERVTPKPLLRLPVDIYLWDMKRRIHNGRNIV